MSIDSKAEPSLVAQEDIRPLDAERVAEIAALRGSSGRCVVAREIDQMAFEILRMRHNLRNADKPIPMRLACEGCGELHIDEGEFAHRVGVRFLPGFKNEAP